jgi:UDP-2-acetamido-3-amino-2,3-dideoxy-glucuronate N-acetyltransferase
MTKQVRLIPLELYSNGVRGDISVIQDLPFVVKRLFNIYNVPADVLRGGHAHKKCQQFFIATSGAVLIKIQGGAEYILDCPEIGLYVPPLHIIHLTFLSKESVLTVLASEKYDKDDYFYG